MSIFMKTEKEIDEYRKEIEKRLIGTESMDAMKYYQGVLRALDWTITGMDV
jgi:hypothetical protein